MVILHGFTLLCIALATFSILKVDSNLIEGFLSSNKLTNLMVGTMRVSIFLTFMILMLKMVEVTIVFSLYDKGISYIQSYEYKLDNEESRNEIFEILAIRKVYDYIKEKDKNDELELNVYTYIKTPDDNVGSEE